MEIVTLFYYKKWMICLTPINWSIMKLFFLFIIILNLFSCGDDGPNCPGDMVLPVNINPYKEVYEIGDTIIVTSRFHKLIYDLKTEKLFDASKYNFSPKIEFHSLDSANGPYEGSQIEKYTDYLNQDISTLKYFYIEKSTAIAGEYEVRNDSIYFKVKLKLKKTGNFWIRISSLSTGDSHLQNNYKFNCRGRYINFELESPKENNIGLMQKFRSIYPNDYYLSDSIHRFYNHAGYCFEVR